MIYLQKILVPTDLSEFSLAAMEHATSLGLLYGSRIYLLHVIEKHPHGGVSEHTDPAARSDQAEQELGEFVRRNIKPEVKLVKAVRVGAPADEIRSFAEEEGVDLIVMATHGRTGLRHIVMGSVAEKVVRHSAIPVLTVKPPPLRERIIQDEDIENELHLG